MPPLIRPHIPPELRPEPQPRTGAFPLFPALAALALFVAGLEVYSWVSDKQSGPLRFLATTLQATPSWVPGAPTVLSQKGKVFDNEQALPAPQEPLLRLTLPIRPQDIQLGTPTGRVHVMILTDPACGTCRSALHDWLAASNRQGVHVTVKFWPQNPQRLTGGLVFALAQKAQIVPALWTNLRKAKGDLTDNQLLEILEQSGMPLAAQREALASLPDLGQTMDADLAQARKIGLPQPPQVAVDGTVIDPADLATAIDARLQSKPLENDEWMMKR